MEKNITKVLDRVLNSKVVKLTGSELKFMVPFVLTVAKKRYTKDFNKIIKHSTSEKKFAPQCLGVYQKIAEKDMRIRVLFKRLFIKVLNYLLEK